MAVDYNAPMAKMGSCAFPLTRGLSSAAMVVLIVSAIGTVAACAVTVITAGIIVVTR